MDLSDAGQRVCAPMQAAVTPADMVMNLSAAGTASHQNVLHWPDNPSYPTIEAHDKLPDPPDMQPSAAFDIHPAKNVSSEAGEFFVPNPQL